VRWCDLIQNVGRGIAQHALGPDIEDLNHPTCIGCNAREICAVENGALQRTGSGSQQVL
jgi:hypothetical protein